MGIGNGVVIRFLADTGQAIRDIGKLERATGKSMGRMGKATSVFRKTIGPAMAGVAAAAGAYATKLAADGVQAAIDDEASQAKLAQAMENTTAATEAQIAAMEDYISLAQQRTGLDDGDMRSGLARLLRSTKSTTRAQQIMNTAMEISLATGKPLGQVVEALAKFNDGNAGALKRLGITMGDASQGYVDMQKAVKELKKAEDDAARARETYGPKSKEYAKAQEKVAKAAEKIANIQGNGGIKWLAELNKQFDGAAAKDADTYAGKTRRIATAFSELQESFGKGLLSSFQGMGDEMGGMDDTLYTLGPAAEDLGKSLGDIATSVGQTMVYLGPMVEKFNELNDMGGGILTDGTLVTAMKSLARINFAIAAMNGDTTGMAMWANEAGLPGVSGGVNPEADTNLTPEQKRKAAAAFNYNNAPRLDSEWSASDAYRTRAGTRRNDAEGRGGNDAATRAARTRGVA